MKNDTYKIKRPFNIVTKDGLSEVAQDFVDYILSADGQKIVEDNGYIDRGRDREDRRAARVTLTAHGTKLMGDTRDEYCEIFDTCFPGISQHEFSEFFLV